MPTQQCMQISSMCFATHAGKKKRTTNKNRNLSHSMESNGLLCKFHIFACKHEHPNPSFFNKWVEWCQKNMVSPSWQHAQSAGGKSLPSETRSSENYFISQHAPPCSSPCELLLLGGVCRGVWLTLQPPWLMSSAFSNASLTASRSREVRTRGRYQRQKGTQRNGFTHNGAV